MVTNIQPKRAYHNDKQRMTKGTKKVCYLVNLQVYIWTIDKKKMRRNTWLHGDWSTWMASIGK